MLTILPHMIVYDIPTIEGEMTESEKTKLKKWRQEEEEEGCKPKALSRGT